MQLLYLEPKTSVLGAELLQVVVAARRGHSARASAPSNLRFELGDEGCFPLAVSSLSLFDERAKGQPQRSNGCKASLQQTHQCIAGALLL